MAQSRQSVWKELHDAGFDRSRPACTKGKWNVRCSQCEALVINGVPCHETGCPNKRKALRRVPK